MNNQKLIFITGILGAVLLAAGLVLAAINSAFTLPASLLTGTGSILAMVYIVVRFEQIKRLVTARGTRYKGGTAALVIVIVAILGMLNFLASRHNKRLDVTESALYSLSSQTINILQSLNNEIRVIAFTTDQMKGVTEDLFGEYLYHTKQIKVEYYDINKKPALAREYGVTREGTIIIECGDRREKLDEQPTEELVTNALLKVTRTGRNTVYFLKGHDEKDIKNTEPGGCSQIKKQLEDENFIVKELLLIQTGEVPDDCDVLVVAGPKKDLVKAEKQALAAFLDENGKALVMVDPEQPGLDKVLAPWQVKVGNDMLVDINPEARRVGISEFMPVASKYEPHRITERFKSATVFPFARSIQVAQTGREGVKAEELVRTSQTSWAETNLQAEAVKFDEGKDLKGPVNLAVAVTSREKDRKDPDEIKAPGDTLAEAADLKNEAQTRLVVVGDSDFANNNSLMFPGNSDLFLNMVSWLAQEEDLISVRPKEQRDRRIFLTLKQSRIIFLLSVVVFPLIVLMCGVWVWLTRKK